MKRVDRKRSKAMQRVTIAKRIPAAAVKRASIFRNGDNQTIRLPQEFRFPKNVKEVCIRKQGDSLLLSPARPDWASFFVLEVSVPQDCLASCRDLPPQSRDPL